MDGQQPETRDERILAALGAGESSTAGIAAATGMPELTTRAGLVHLRKEGLIVAPERGRYRLTGLGRTVLDDGAAPGQLRQAPAADPPPPVAVGSPGGPTGDVGQLNLTGAGPLLALVGLGAAALLAWTIAHLRRTPPPPAPPADPWAPSSQLW